VQQLREAQAETSQPVSSVRSAQTPSRWRVGDRLIVAFTAGTSKRRLAEGYGISESSVKRLVRQHTQSKQSSALSPLRRYRLELHES
jgi:hypothetical protein